MMTTINDYVAMEQPEQNIGDLLVADQRGLMLVDSDASIDDLGFDTEIVRHAVDQSWMTPVTDMRPVKSGPFAVELGGDDDTVIYFRNALAATVFASQQLDAPIEFVGRINNWFADDDRNDPEANLYAGSPMFGYDDAARFAS